ncbi:MAG: hypothetical protein AAFU61_03310, partial [Pseudomonadota bacterium]
MTAAAEFDVPAAETARPSQPVRRGVAWDQVYHHAVLIVGAILMMGPIVVAFLSSTYTPLEI